MRLWTLHPSLLDSKGLVALWREGLGAQAALHELTNGYSKHPQLNRWRGYLGSFSVYMKYVYRDSAARGYNFQQSKLIDTKGMGAIPLIVTIGQVKYELKHLLTKLEHRDPKQFHLIIEILANSKGSYDLLVNPIFVIDYNWDKVESWEKV